MSKAVNDFIKMAKKEARDAGIKVRLPKTQTVIVDNIKVNGYFDDDIQKMLKCAIGKPEKEWFPMFVHEYCHF